MTMLQQVCPRFLFAVSFHTAWFVARAVLLLAVWTQPPAHAITINMTYTDEGSTPPHPENPTWDPAGVILKAHFQAAKTIWESLLPGGGTYSFDFHWDNDIDGLGQYTPGADEFIEINPDFDWFADFTPGDNIEFAAPTQRLYSGLSTSDQSFYFPGSAPPGALEVNFQSTGHPNGTFVNGLPVNTLSASGQIIPGTATPVDASNGYDLLSTVLHEIGHVLGINGVEPGDYNIDPAHIGGFTSVLVLEGGGGHLGGGVVSPPNTNIVPGFLMCNSCGVPGLRRFATGTDVLVIAEDQGITVVQLARVGSIISTTWSNSLNWIGGDVPDGTQDVYISHGGTITLDVDARVNNLLVSPGNGLAVGGRTFSTPGALIFTGGALTVASGGTIAAHALVGTPDTLGTAAGSLVRFNSFTETSGTSAGFNGGLAIGYDTDPSGLFFPPSATFNPSLATWNIAENLIVGDELFANLIVDNGTWTVNGNVTLGRVLTFLNGGWTGGVALQNNGVMTIGGNLDLPRGAITVEDTATLNVAGNITIGKQSGITFRDDRAAPSRPYSLAGGRTEIVEGTPIFIAGGTLTFEDTASAADATVTLEGGSGYDAAGALASFKGDSSASTADFRTKGGHLGPSSSGPTQGNGGQVRFEGTSGASNANFVNEGSVEHHTGTGGRTVFAENSSAEQSTIHNHGTVYVNGDGGATEFYNNSTAGSATITNHATGTTTTGAFNTRGRTVFFDSSDAGNATIENEGAPYSPVGSIPPGLTEFRNNSSAAFSNIHNRAVLTASGLGAGIAGRTMFHDSATAADATIHTYEGASDHGRVEFRNQSKAGRARIIMENVPAATSNGGYVNFFDNSSAEQSQIFVRAGVCCFGGIGFNNNATAADVQILTEDGASTFSISFLGNSTAGDPASAPTAATALFTLGRGSVLVFYDQTKAEDAGIALAHGAQLQFQNNSSAGQAQIYAAGSSVFGIEGAAITFNTSSLINNSTITLGGGTASQATGARVLFNNGSHAGNSTITASGGSNGGGGATISFINSYGDTAQIIANAGSTVDIFIQPTFNSGNISLGSIEGAGKFLLRGAHLTTGSRNTNTTVSGPIVDNPPGLATGGRITKVGTGTLTLAGANTYTGLTTVNAGTLSVTGSITGGAVINNGGTLNGTGAIGGAVTVNSGGVFAPGTSPGTITVRGLTMTPGSTLNFEIGDPLRDHIVLTNNGNVSLAGTLNISLLDGFTPALGQSFSMFEGAIGSITGAFDAIIAPTFNGLTFDIMQSASSVLLQVGEAPFLAGDFNLDGVVNAADYVAWRKGVGVAPTTANYNLWRRNFGQSAGSGSGATGSASVPAVPEPASLALIVLSAVAMISVRHTVDKQK